MSLAGSKIASIQKPGLKNQAISTKNAKKLTKSTTFLPKIPINHRIDPLK